MLNMIGLDFSESTDFDNGMNEGHFGRRADKPNLSESFKDERLKILGALCCAWEGFWIFCYVQARMDHKIMHNRLITSWTMVFKGKR